MKPVPITLLSASLFLMLTVASCKKEKSYRNNAVITGYDLRLCACCGGLMVNFDNNPKAYSGPFYDLSNSPASLGIDSTTVFPVFMKVNWTGDTASACAHITITDYVGQ